MQLYGLQESTVKLSDSHNVCNSADQLTFIEKNDPLGILQALKSLYEEKDIDPLGILDALDNMHEERKKLAKELKPSSMRPSLRPVSRDSFPELRRIRKELPLNDKIQEYLNLDTTVRYAIFGGLKSPEELARDEYSLMDKDPEIEDADLDDLWLFRPDPGLAKIAGLYIEPEVKAELAFLRDERAICLSPAMERAIYGTP